MALQVICELCDLNKSTDGFIITICKTCGDVLIVGRSHQAEFTDGERAILERIFPDDDIRWEMRRILGHAHCHIL